MATSLTFTLNLEAPMLCDPGEAAFSGRVQRLTRSIQQGDESAFETFYAEYSPRLYRFTLVLTAGNEDFARELHQEIMIKCAVKMRVMEDETQLWQWLAQVARNAWRDILRKKGREGRCCNIDEMAFALSETALEDRLLEILEAAIESLPESEQCLIKQIYFEKHAQKEVAGMTGRTIKAIQSELARVRKKLRTFISKSL